MERRKTPSDTVSVSEAADKAASRMRQLQSRLSEPGESRAGPLARETPSGGTPARTKSQDDDSMEEMEQQLQALFAQTSAKAMPGTGLVNDIRARVVDEIAARILQDWEQQLDTLEEEVVGRLIEKLLERLDSRGLPALPVREIRRR